VVVTIVAGAFGLGGATPGLGDYHGEGWISIPCVIGHTPPQPNCTSSSFEAVDLVDATHAWSVGEGVIASLDPTAGVYTYSDTVLTEPSWELYGVSFADDTHGWAVGDSSLSCSGCVYDVLATSDGGATWTPQKINDVAAGSLRAVKFIDDSSGWAVGAGGLIAATSDGGMTWSTQVSGTSQNLFGVSFVGSDGWAVGKGGTILATTTGGQTWSPQTSNTTQTLAGVSFVDSTHGWAVGGGGTILATIDGGKTWTPQTSNTSQFLYGVSFVDSNHGWAVGAGGTILITSDGGATWMVQQSGLGTNDVLGVSALDAIRAIAVGPPANYWQLSPPVAAAIRVALSPATIVADGQSTTTATITVTDQWGDRISGEPVTLGSSGDATIGPITDIGDGTYLAAIIASGTPGPQTITAGDGTLSATATLTQTPCLTVTNPADDGICSLRQAVTQAATAGGGTITVQAGLGTINLHSPITFASDGPITIDGNGVTVNGNGSNGIFDKTGGSGDLWIDGMTITGSNAGANSAAVVMNELGAGSGQLTLSNCSITGNRGTAGTNSDVVGGVLSLGVTRETPVRVLDCAITNNSATQTEIDGTVVGGLDDEGGSLTIIDSTIANNTATGGASGGDVTGGIDDEGGTFDMNNSTLSSNTASIPSGAIGSGGLLMNGGDGALVYDTLTQNSGGGGGEPSANLLAQWPLTVSDSVIALANGDGPNCWLSPGITSGGYNFSDDSSCDLTATTDRQGAGDPRLGPLRDNGGPGPTELPFLGSPLIAAIPIGSCATGVANDERGVARPQGGGCDIGAVEANYPQLSVSTGLSLPGGGTAPTVPVAPLAPVTDSATILGPGNAIQSGASGTVTYNAYLDSACTQLATEAGVGTVTGGVAAPSTPVAFKTAGRYYFQAVYSGDLSDRPATSRCGSEVLIVNPAIANVSGAKVQGNVILVTVTVNTGGTLTATVVVVDGSTLGAAARARCRPGYTLVKVRKLKRCVSTLFATAAQQVSKPGTYTLRLPAGGPARKALKAGKSLRVKLTITFQSTAGGPPVVKTQTLTVNGTGARRHR
jgi:photosystem II stability/assembly factor-like uncharacterized protein